MPFFTNIVVYITNEKTFYVCICIYTNKIKVIDDPISA